MKDYLVLQLIVQLSFHGALVIIFILTELGLL